MIDVDSAIEAFRREVESIPGIDPAYLEDWFRRHKQTALAVIQRTISGQQAMNADRVVTLNCGLGRDSVTMLLLLLEGQLVVGGRVLNVTEVDAVVFSDTGWEWRHSYAVLFKVREMCRRVGLRVIVLAKPGEGTWEAWAGNKVRGVRRRSAPPWLRADGWASIEDKAAEGGYHRRPGILEDYQSRSTVVSISKGDCSSNHKIEPIRRLILDLARERFGVPDNATWGRLVRKGERRPHVSLIGIAADEVERTIGHKGLSYVTEFYPLIEMGIAKGDEQPILERHGLGWVRKSGCMMCPYQPPSWYWLLRESEPGIWKAVVEYEHIALTLNPRMYLTGRKPIAEVVDDWRAKNPDLTIEEVLGEGYDRCNKWAA